MVNALNRAFNKTRVHIMKKFAPSSRELKALKRY
ncbi:hypothetical protein [Pediococcus acidilactici]|nr:hypothetical protein [Pediococcus acidilactici]